MTFTLRPAVFDDAPALAALKLATFRETFIDGFGIPYPPEDLALFEHENYAPERVAQELSDPARMLWVVEDDAGALLGYAHVGRCNLTHPERGNEDGEIYQLYLLNKAQGRGIGRHLLNKALDYLAGERPGPVWLGVWSGNLKAQAIYQARGFAHVGDYQFKVGQWRDDEFIFRRG